MSIKPLLKQPAIKELTPQELELKKEEFLSKGAIISEPIVNDKDHKLLLRIPKQLLDQVDSKRGKVVTESRNLWILKAIQKVLQD